MLKENNFNTALITGSSGFIGFHVAKILLDEGWLVTGLDSMSNYYDLKLKKDRLSILLKYENYKFIKGKIEDKNLLRKTFQDQKPQIVIHLAAQAGVRYSIEQPREYLESNIIGTYELLEAAREFPPKHILIASTSSAYGANEKMPYKETDKADLQMSFYAATKKSTENMSHSYSHLFDLPITAFRFFTVYGPWGRPDMALFKFTKAIISGEKIDVYNHGDMRRDFTYIDDLIKSIRLLIDAVPESKNSNLNPKYKNDNLSPVAPFRLVNIGNSKPEKLIDFIAAIEKKLGIKADMNLMPIQAGDVPVTWADTSLLSEIADYTPGTPIEAGVSNFIDWYNSYYEND
jgi:UDP-glucuronate 4-epimerase